MRILNFHRQDRGPRGTARGVATGKRGRRQELAGGVREEHTVGATLASLLALTVVWFCASASIVYRRSLPEYEYVPGQVVDTNVYSEVQFQYEDAAETRRLRELAAHQEPAVCRIDGTQVDLTRRGLNDLMASRHDPDGAGNGDGPPGGVARDVATAVQALSAEGAAALDLLAASPDRCKLLEGLLLDSARRGVARVDDIEPRFGGAAASGMVCLVDDHNRKTLQAVDALATPATVAAGVADALVGMFPENGRPLRAALTAVLPLIVLPNLTLDAAGTAAARAKASAAVTPVRRVVHPDSLLLRRGSRVTREALVQLSEHQRELQHVRQRLGNTREMAVFSILCLLLVLAFALALYTIRPDVTRDTASVLLIGLVVALQILLSRAVADAYYRYWLSRVFLFPALPLSLGAMLLSQLVGSRVAVVAAGLTSLVAAVPHGLSMEVFLIGALSSTVGATCIRRARRRFHVLRTGLAVGATVAAVTILLLMRSGVPVDLDVTGAVLGLAMANGIALTIVVSTVLPLFEYVFGVTTDISLLELTDLNHPLLRRLQMEAPGTYHHSLMVATLAEQAAAAIGANPLLARVCAYFHDIGKLAHPEYFAENLTGSNPHDDLKPSMSSLVILNHVKEGLDLAFRHKLKKVIREAIAQHHGTSLVYYFYQRALSLARETGSRALGEHDYRYPGPPPGRKEIVLVSLADACEAAVRALEKPTPQKIRSQVDEIVANRIRDGQLNRANLSLRELAVARETIARTLVNMLHGRIRYPKGNAGHEGDPDQAATPAKADQPSPPPAAGPASRPGDGPGAGSRPDAASLPAGRRADGAGPHHVAEPPVPGP